MVIRFVRSAAASAVAALVLAALPAVAQTSPVAPAPATPAPAPSAFQGAPVERTFALSAALGPTFGGTLTVANGSEEDFDVDPGFVARAALDFYLIPKLTMGLYVLTAQMSLPERDEDFGVTGFGGTIMGRFGMPDRPHLRAGLALGYQTNSFETPSADDSAGLGLGAILEFAYPVGRSGAALLGQLSFLTQAAGGNENYDITFGPIFYLAIGAEFGK